MKEKNIKVALFFWFKIRINMSNASLSTTKPRENVCPSYLFSLKNIHSGWFDFKSKWQNLYHLCVCALKDVHYIFDVYYGMFFFTLFMMIISFLLFLPSSSLFSFIHELWFGFSLLFFQKKMMVMIQRYCVETR